MVHICIMVSSLANRNLYGGFTLNFSTWFFSCFLWLVKGECALNVNKVKLVVMPSLRVFIPKLPYSMFPFPCRQCLSLPTSAAHHPPSPVVLCTHFCQMVGHNSVDTSLSPVPCKQRGVSGVCTLVSPEKAPRLAHSMLVKSPAKVGWAAWG